MSLRTLVPMLALLAPHAAFGQPWCHEIHTAGDGTRLQWDYQVMQTAGGRFGYDHSRVNNYIHISRPGLTGQESVTGVVVTLYKGPADSEFHEFGRNLVSEAAYNSAEERFTLSLPPDAERFLIRTPYGLFQYELAVVIDGHWLKVRGQDSSNFRFDALAYHGFCANPG